jgi:hypothetical protein
MKMGAAKEVRAPKTRQPQGLAQPLALESAEEVRVAGRNGFAQLAVNLQLRVFITGKFFFGCKEFI